MTLFAALAAAAAALVTAFLSNWISEELRGRLDGLPHWLIGRAVRRMPAEIRHDVDWGWTAELNAVLRDSEGLPVTRLCRGIWFALGLLRFASSMERRASLGRDRLDRLPRRLLRVAARRLAAEVRDDVVEEWVAELHVILHDSGGFAVARLCRGIWFALGLLVTARTIDRDLSGTTILSIPTGSLAVSGVGSLDLVSFYTEKHGAVTLQFAPDSRHAARVVELTPRRFRRGRWVRVKVWRKATGIWHAGMRVELTRDLRGPVLGPDLLELLDGLGPAPGEPPPS
jgi:hypothetical protein